jgi:hypothetical protein
LLPAKVNFVLVLVVPPSRKAMAGRLSSSSTAEVMATTGHVAMRAGVAETTEDDQKSGGIPSLFSQLKAAQRSKGLDY